MRYYFYLYPGLIIWTIFGQVALDLKLDLLQIISDEITKFSKIIDFSLRNYFIGPILLALVRRATIGCHFDDISCSE